MEARGWSEYRLSKECGLSESTLANIFRRNTLPSQSTLEAICKAFGITLSQFYAENDMIELTEENKELFNGWSTLTPEQKTAVLKIIDLLNNK
jgi:transcriptional regulator with XRE-family HTH domain